MALPLKMVAVSSTVASISFSFGYQTPDCFHLSAKRRRTISPHDGRILYGRILCADVTPKLRRENASSHLGDTDATIVGKWFFGDGPHGLACRTCMGMV